ncbi:MAG: hypothetical protein CO113_01885 [Elusimicrobia bacterium CG_4_9_14_3_um_filter_62_55]|nr:MAG: hypothetical protein COR54_10945 [Elusimicrobia bacterium CG22_combo_CG10-13_8_21_14_all_63_91]PJA18336.1 MAG: hypothetical protein COX66_01470 [Elusimicrobia bacterium CG_4_10_14_0_2_um_filter_63_34]PJB26763.1 MAG: hypothetical protein CO113_01885 [Elusimicrobia bacterium CG_4_9_14_3_um_filter_62_55]
MSGDPLKGELVETGSFRIDRRRTLDKLQRYQLPGGERGFLAWIRTAVAGGAREIEVRASGRDLRLDFGGAPFEKAAMHDPYGALFERSGKFGERDRHFALGMLWAWRSGAMKVTVSSGGRSLKSSGLAEDEVSPCPESARTSIRVRLLPHWPRSMVTESLTAEFFARECALVPGRLTLNGNPLPQEPIPDWNSYRFASGTVRGVITVPEPGCTGKNRLGLFVFGVRVCDHEAPGAGLPFDGAINDDGFGLNASLTKVVANAALNAGLAELQRHYGRFLAHCAKELTRRAAGTGKMLVGSQRLRKEWKRLFDFDSTNDGEPERSWLPWNAPLSKRLRVHVDARVTSWLRLVTETLSRGYSREPLESFERALWRAPLIFDVRGRPVSLERLLREDRGPRIRFSTKRRSAHTRADWIVWALTRRDAAWLRRVGKRVPIDVTQLPERAW